MTMFKFLNDLRMSSAQIAFKRLMEVTADDRCRNAGIGCRDKRFIWLV